MNEIIPIIDKLAFLAFVVATMFGTGLKLTVQQIWQPLLQYPPGYFIAADKFCLSATFCVFAAASNTSQRTCERWFYHHGISICSSSFT